MIPRPALSVVAALAGLPTILLRNVKLPRPAAKTISAIMVVAAVSANKTHSARRRSTATAAATNAIATAERYRAKEMSVAPGRVSIGVLWIGCIRMV